MAQTVCVCPGLSAVPYRSLSVPPSMTETGSMMPFIIKAICLTLQDLDHLTQC